MILSSDRLLHAQDRLSAHIQTTEPLTPEEQLRRFRVPPGFEVQLVAAEPQIQKPLNLAFDARGRLWVTGSVEYPYLAKAGAGRDSIRVLTDTDRDGRADQVSVFAEGLNIPMGLYPYRNGVVAYNAPNIMFYSDADGDGEADTSEVLYGPLGDPVDTHGMQNAFRRGYDGWLYICHGFANRTVIRGKDGSEVELASGNTYRVRLDGSRVEQFTWGQVNPFGSAFTVEGELITADCHSKPLTMLLRGAYYPSFGKPHDGVGFMPALMDHGHGSTGIAGAAVLATDSVPEEYRGSVLVGNVITHRIHRDVLMRRGATVRAQEQPDFLTCDDPWFRPVDLQLGPDGAIYIADFYNRIIGHYEVPLDHPGRDRDRGRIWRVVYTGKQDPPPWESGENLAEATSENLVAAVGHPNLRRRMLAMDQLSDRIGAAGLPAIRESLSTAESTSVKVHLLWTLHRLGVVTLDEIRRAAQDQDAVVRRHAMQVLAESSSWSPEFQRLAVQGLNDPASGVQLSATDALAQHVSIESVRSLLEADFRVGKKDPSLRHAIRIALRNQIRNDQITRSVLGAPIRSEDLATLAAAAVAVPTQSAAELILQHLTRQDRATPLSPSMLQHIVKNLPQRQMEEVVALVADRAGESVDLQVQLIQAVEEQLQRQGAKRPPRLREWGLSLATRLLDSAGTEQSQWSVYSGDDTWDLESRRTADGKEILFLSSFPGGEQKKSILRSRRFTLPASMSFFLCGHRGFPENEPGTRNFVRLRLVETGQTIKRAFPPRNDVAHEIKWELDEYEGQEAFVEVVDGNQLNAFAWLAVARFNPPILQVPSVGPRKLEQRWQAAASIARTLRLSELLPQINRILGTQSGSVGVRASFAAALSELEPLAFDLPLLELAQDVQLRPELREKVLGGLVVRKEQTHKDLLRELLKEAPLQLQSRLADSISANRPGAELLLGLVEDGTASARLLQNAALKEKLVAAKVPRVQARIDQLVESLPPLDAMKQELIADRRKGFEAAERSLARGQQVFVKQCSGCHQIQGFGSVVGPQLDGIGNRGPDRILEDILDPNRNLDASFQTSLVLLEDGRIRTGLLRRHADQTRYFVGSDGKEFGIPDSEVEEIRKIRTSIMPDNFSSLLKPDEFYDLVEFLLSRRQVPPTKVSWNAQRIDPAFRSEAVSVADVNRDGKADVLVGELWYEAPTWEPHEISPVGDYGDGSRGYSQSFSCFTHDVDHDGWPDLIRIGFPGAPCHWLRNPQGVDKHWEQFEIAEAACNESPLFVELFPGKTPVLVMGWNPGDEAQRQMAWFEPADDPTQPWRRTPISPPGAPGTARFSHGLGVGDLNQDGRPDVICTEGWWEQPEAASRTWNFHPAKLGPASAHMHVEDCNLDGRPDVLASSAHDYGIWWHEQLETGDFERRDLFPQLVSQTHSLAYSDIDGDGLQDLVTGKRWWAHGPQGDAGASEPAILYWFQAVREQGASLRFIPRVIHTDSGVGTQFCIADVNGDELPDVITSNKKGVFVFTQRR